MKGLQVLAAALFVSLSSQIASGQIAIPRVTAAPFTATRACPAVTRGIRSSAGERTWRTMTVVKLTSMAHSVIQISDAMLLVAATG